METSIPVLSPLRFLHYTDSVTATCMHYSVVYLLLQPLIFLDLLSEIVMAMQNKHTILIAAGFSLEPSLSPLISEAFYSAKKLEKPGEEQQFATALP